MVANQREVTYAVFQNKYYPNGYRVGEGMKLEYDEETGKPEFRDKYSETPEYKEYKNSNVQLDNLFEKFDIDTVLDIITLMYIGRDYDSSERIPKEKIFSDYRERFGQRGWDDKRIVARQITQKLPLGKYLTRGLEITDI